MEQHVHIRMATVNDLTDMLAIYAPFVRDTNITFEYTPPTLDEFATRFAELHKRFPWLVAVVDGTVRGYAYAGPLFSRSAYMWSAELSVYVSEGFRRMDLGSRMVNAVTGLLTRQGYRKVYALINALNFPCIRLMEQQGFEREACLKHVGYKLDEWHDVVWLGKKLCVLDEKPEPPVACCDLPPVLLCGDAEAGV